MNALWNKKSLEHPANNIWIAKRDAIDLKSFSSILETALRDLESQNTLHAEAAVLSRLIYRMKSKFRSDKGLKNMEKVNRALLNYLEIELTKEYQNLRNYIEVDELVVNLPTKQMLEYILIRTQGFAKLMARIESVAKKAAEFFRVRISIGHAWTVSVIAYAVISRVWFLSRYLLKRCCIWYNGIRKHLKNFKKVGPAWLPLDYKLPDDLKVWLDLPWIDQASDSVPLKDDGKETIFGLIKARDDDTCRVNFDEEDITESEEVEEKEERLEPIDEAFFNPRIKTKGEISSPVKYGLSFSSDDVGMSIDREAYAAEGRRDNFKEDIKKEEEESTEESETVERNDEALKKRSVKKSRVSRSGDMASPILTKKRKTNSDRIDRTTANESFEKSKDQLLTRSAAIIETRGKKVKKKGKSTISHTPENCLSDNKLSNIDEIKTRNDLAIFLNNDSHPSLDKLQWNMMINSIKKYLVKLDKFEVSSSPSSSFSYEREKEIVVLKKINRQINNWIQ